MMSHESKQTLLAERARRLAMPRVAADHTAAADMMGVLVFVIGDERLAMPLASIVTIIRAAAVTPLPHAVAPVYGVAAWRGRPLTVLTLASVAATALVEAESRLVVLGDGGRTAVGLLVQSIDETRLVARSALLPAHSGARRAMAIGVTDDAVLVLDAETLLEAARSES